MVVAPAALPGHPAEQPHLVAGALVQAVVPAGGGVVLDDSGPLRAVGRDGAREADEFGDGGGVLAGGLQEVLDLKDVAGDLKVAVAVHGCGGSSAWGVHVRGVAVSVGSSEGAAESARCGGERGRRRKTLDRRGWIRAGALRHQQL